MGGEELLGSPGFGGKVKAAFSFVFNAYFSYSTVRLAKIHSMRTIVCFRLFQLIIIGYIIGWNIVYKKGYQEFDTVSSTVTSKVKGLGFVNHSNELVPRVYNGKLLIDTGSNMTIFDTADYVVPPSEYNSIFVMTNYWDTKQQQGLCDEDNTRVNCTCKTDADCTEKMVTTNTWNGIPTGRCINSSVTPNLTVCEIASWCPVEREARDSKTNLIHNVLNYTIFIKNDIQFKLFNKKQRNLLTNITNDYIASCAYLPVRDPNCPVFVLGEILNKAENIPSERALMLQKGGVIQIDITWTCNYDIWWDPCVFEYSFNRFDLDFSVSTGASGFNFRFAEKFEEDGQITRILVKAYGLRFIIVVNGKAGKFNMVPLLITIGSGLGLLTVASIAADVFLLNCTKKKKIYEKLKIHDYESSEKLQDDVDSDAAV